MSMQMFILDDGHIQELNLRPTGWTLYGMVDEYVSKPLVRSATYSEEYCISVLMGIALIALRKPNFHPSG